MSLLNSIQTAEKEPTYHKVRPRWQEQVPLEVNGKVLRGAKVYTGPDRRDENPYSPVPGQITVHGLKLGELILEPPRANYQVQHKNVTIARSIVWERLPISRYRSYVCVPGTEVHSGLDAVRSAQEADLKVDARAVLALFSVSKSSEQAAAPPVREGVSWV